MSKLKYYIAATVIITSLLLPASVLAQQANYRGLVVRLPEQDDFFVDFEYVKPGAVLSGKFILQHEYEEENQPAVLYLFAADFELANDGVTPIEPEDGQFLESDFSLARYVKFDRTSVQLDRYGDNVTINYTIALPNDVPPGLRYTRLVASTASADIKSGSQVTNSTGAGIVSRVSVATVAVSIGDPSQLTTSGELADVAVRDIDNNPGLLGFLFDLTPINLVTTIRNTGTNVLLLGGNVTWHSGDPTQPNEFQKFNEGRVRVLPNKNRNFTNSWRDGIMYASRRADGGVDYVWNIQNGVNLRWGRHVVDLRANYKDGSGNTKILVETIEFWILPWKAILLLTVVLIAAFMLNRYRSRLKYVQKSSAKLKKKTKLK